MHTIAVGGSQLDVADSAFGPKNQQLSVVALTGFENVSRHAFEKRELAPGEKPENIVLHFNPQTGQDMLLACLWDRWSAPGEQPLNSFTAITDEPLEAIAAAGHDRRVIPLAEANIDAWLNAAGRGISDLYKLLDDRSRP